MTDTMRIWNQVWRTPQDMTKKVNQRGGFTAVCAQYQIREATKLWGPYGKGWGVRGLEYDIIRDGKGDPVAATLKAEFYYPEGAFEMGTDITFRAGDDMRKKLLTDLTTKALSKLGFSADIFEGRFEDNKYLQENAAYFARERQAEEAKKATDADKSALLKDVADFLSTHGVQADATWAKKLVVKVASQELGKTHIDTKEELDRVGQAILSGSYTPDTGEKAA